jgi:hypothetical protein
MRRPLFPEFVNTNRMGKVLDEGKAINRMVCPKRITRERKGDADGRNPEKGGSIYTRQGA